MSISPDLFDDAQTKSSAPGVCIAIDPGRARHGIAVCDELGITSSPLYAIDAVPESDAIDEIVSLLIERNARRLIIGLPLNMDGTEGPSTQFSRELGDKILAVYSIEIVFVGETLTTDAAESRLTARGLTNKQRKRRIDAHAAQIILNDYLSNRK